jgi:hypothetical protein
MRPNIMGKPLQTPTQAKASTIQANTAPAGKAVASSKAKAADVVPIQASKEIKLPGGNVVSSEVDRRSGRPSVAVTVAPPNGLKVMGGSEWPEFNQALLEATLATIPDNNPNATPNRFAAASAALAAFKPVDELEGMLAAQAVAMHHTATECFRRALIADQPADVASKLRKDGANLARGMTDMLDALDRKRGKGPQVVRVERVVVHEGGQAIVGNVQPIAAPKVGGAGG